MRKRDLYRDHVDPEYQRWGRTYKTFPGVDECVRLILEGKATGAWADIFHFELAHNANEYLNQIIDTFHSHTSEDVAVYMLMALETAALPESVDFLSTVLVSGDPRFTTYAKRALTAIDTRESRTALFNATDA